MRSVNSSSRRRASFLHPPDLQVQDGRRRADGGEARLQRGQALLALAHHPHQRGRRVRGRFVGEIVEKLDAGIEQVLDEQRSAVRVAAQAGLVAHDDDVESVTLGSVEHRDLARARHGRPAPPPSGTWHLLSAKPHLFSATAHLPAGKRHLPSATSRRVASQTK